MRYQSLESPIYCERKELFEQVAWLVGELTVGMLESELEKVQTHISPATRDASKDLCNEKAWTIT
jgi:hypothetical protein